MTMQHRRLYLSLLLIALFCAPLRAQTPTTQPLLKENDRLAFIGSSSTRIGVWPATLEFLLRTRHPELKLTFSRHTTGGGTFATGLQNMDKWLAESKPTVVLFNYGGNDAAAGETRLPAFRANIDASIEKVNAAGARAILMTHQPSDLKYPKVKKPDADKRTLYAQAMLSHARNKNYIAIDTHQPLATLLEAARKDDPSFTIMVDQIHLDEPAYVAWAVFLYERLGLPAAESSATLTAAGKVTSATNCAIKNFRADNGSLSFTRTDAILPILPPAKLPPRKHSPLESSSRYLLTITDLPAGTYAITVNDKLLGQANDAALAGGVNLNSLLLDSGKIAPWTDLARDFWKGQSLDQIGHTTFHFTIRRTNNQADQ